MVTIAKGYFPLEWLGTFDVLMPPLVIKGWKLHKGDISPFFEVDLGNTGLTSSQLK